MAGTVVVDAVKSSTTGAPTFQNTSGTEIGQLCRAWVNFNGTGTVAIRASFNVSSITDNGTGDYTVNFTNAMPDTNYCVVGQQNDWTYGSGTTPPKISSSTTYTLKTTTQCRVSYTSAGDYFDINVAIFR